MVQNAMARLVIIYIASATAEDNPTLRDVLFPCRRCRRFALIRVAEVKMGKF